MGCCNSRPFYKQRQAGGPVDYAECLKLLAEQKDPAGFLSALCRTAGVTGQSGAAPTENGEAARPGLQCIVVPVAGLCQEITIFNLSNEILHKLIKCTFASLFSRLGTELFQQVYSQYDLFLAAGDGLNFATFSSLFASKLQNLYATYKEMGSALDFYQYLHSSRELKALEGCKDLKENYALLATFFAKAKFLEELSEEFTKTEFALCQKFLRIEIDLVLLSTRITELSTNTQGGISGITEALRRVATGAANRYFEEDDFDDLFDAAEEVADVIEKLARLYRERFQIFAEISHKLLCSRPQPPVKTVIREIPTLSPTVII